jgi:hypothetical protein
VCHQRADRDRTAAGADHSVSTAGTGQGGGRLQPTADTLVGAAIDYFTAVPAAAITVVFFLAYKDVELDAVRSLAAPAVVQVSDTTVLSLPATSLPRPRWTEAERCDLASLST